MSIIDLTMLMSGSTPLLPYDPKPEFKQSASIEKEGWNSHRISVHTHFGTHIDAPWHMIPQGKKLTDFPIEKFVGSALLIDVRGQSEIDANLKKVRPGDILILRTDHTRRAGSPGYFNNSPVISPALGRQIVDKGVSILGIDTFSVDNEPHAIHKSLFSRDILILENLVNLDKIDVERFEIIILPLKLAEIDGAPCRVIARIS